MTTCPNCERDVDRDQLFDDRECPKCETTLDNLYRLAAGLPVRSQQSGCLWGRRA